MQKKDPPLVFLGVTYVNSVIGHIYRMAEMWGGIIVLFHFGRRKARIRGRWGLNAIIKGGLARIMRIIGHKLRLA